MGFSLFEFARHAWTREVNSLEFDGTPSEVLKVRVHENGVDAPDIVAIFVNRVIRGRKIADALRCEKPNLSDSKGRRSAQQLFTYPTRDCVFLAKSIGTDGAKRAAFAFDGNRHAILSFLVETEGADATFLCARLKDTFHGRFEGARRLFAPTLSTRSKLSSFLDSKRMEEPPVPFANSKAGVDGRFPLPGHAAYVTPQRVR
jgi:hypothetical protein